MLPVLQVGPLAIRTPELPLLAGLWIALEFASREGARRGIHPDRVYNLSLLMLAAGVIAARIGFVLFHLDLYMRITPWTRAAFAVFAVSSGTEVWWIGLLAALGAAVRAVRRHDLSPLDLADSFAPAVAVMAIAIGLANLLGGGMLGGPTGLPWAITLGGAPRHPVALLLALTGGVALMLVLRRRARRESRPPAPPGALIQLVALVLSVGILLIEPLRADSPVIGPGLRAWQIGALVVLVAALAGFALRAPASPDST
jgi:phosphatidylglycerol:prolipoprotein diacylglycerol transferase